MNIVLIEDEEITSADLARTIVHMMPKARIAAVLHSVEEGCEYFAQAPEPDLIFADIQLGDGLSFEVLKALPRPVPVVFCTAYNQYYAEAFAASGIDYLLKPFTAATVQKALMRYQQLRDKFSMPAMDYAHLMQALQQGAAPQKQAVIVRMKDKIIPVATENIALFFVAEGNTWALGFEGQKWLISETLEELETSVGPRFYRANRQYLVQRKAVKNAYQHSHRKLAIELTIPFTETILVGKLKGSAFVDWLAGVV